MKRERLERSRLLIPKSYKEKQALTARQKYKQSVIRVQFPDRVFLQGVFLPGEKTTGSLFEFVASALKQPGLEFELICPAVPRPRVVLIFQIWLRTTRQYSTFLGLSVSSATVHNDALKRQPWTHLCWICCISCSSGPDAQRLGQGSGTALQQGPRQQPP